ncbi:hypothetical protein AU511_14730 [Lonsdalea iberica]|uniref:Uncharacterized protein n=1 Tax=Lonsdalea iberica TaxID=1082703 RepID=A0A1X3RP41_9GAMM|nr:hypothetical protein AU511_14730 [Lonsdalea iberica]
MEPYESGRDYSPFRVSAKLFMMSISANLFEFSRMSADWLKSPINHCRATNCYPDLSYFGAEAGAVFRHDEQGVNPLSS